MQGFLILNDTEIDSDDYVLYREKIVDYEFYFSPSLDFSSSVVRINSDLHADFIRKKFALLDCSNIRVMISTVKIIDNVVPRLGSLHHSTVEDIISSIILFRCVKERCGKAKIIPDLEYFRNFESIYFSFLDSSEKDAALKLQEDFLSGYGFYNTDEKDLCLIDGVDCGYVDVDRLIQCSASLDRESLNNDRNKELANAWNIFRTGFDNNADLFVDGLVAAIEAGVAVTNFNDVNSAVRIMRKLGYSERADDLIDFFINNRAKDIETIGSFENLFHMSFSEVDAFLVDKMKSVKSLRIKPEPLTLLSLVADDKYLSEDDLSVLAEADIQVYVDFLKNGRNDLTIVQKVKSFREMRAYSDASRIEIYRKMYEALKIISSENLINEIRVRSLEFGI